MPLTPEMGLDLPIVQLTFGPEWASKLNTALELVDSHDHSPGNGVAIAAAALNINQDLSFQGNSATNLEATSYSSQLADPATVQSVYSKGGDLYFYNSAGDAVQITNGNSLAGTPGAITGLGDGGSSGIYYDGTDTLAFYYNSTYQAKFDIATIQLHPYETGVDHPEFIGIAAPISLAASYTLTLPGAAPSQNLPIVSDTTGQIGFGFAPGSATAPSAAFATDLDTGFYSLGANSVGLSLGGVLRVDFSINNLVLRPDGTEAGRFAPGQLQMVSGSAATPSMSFGSATTSGFYHITGTSIGLSLAGVQRIDFSANNLVFKPDGTEAGRFFPGQLHMVSGSTGTPPYTFGSDSDTGMYNPATNVLGFVTAGGIRTSLTAGGQQFYEGGVGGGEAKWKIFSGSIGAGASVTLNGPGTSILGCFGYRGNFDVIGYTAVGVYFRDAAATNQARITNALGTTQTYIVVMFYQ